MGCLRGVVVVCPTGSLAEVVGLLILFHALQAQPGEVLEHNVVILPVAGGGGGEKGEQIVVRADWVLPASRCLCRNPAANWWWGYLPQNQKAPASGSGGADEMHFCKGV